MGSCSPPPKDPAGAAARNHTSARCGPSRALLGCGHVDGRRPDGPSPTSGGHRPGAVSVTARPVRGSGLRGLEAGSLAAPRGPHRSRRQEPSRASRVGVPRSRSRRVGAAPRPPAAPGGRPRALRGRGHSKPGWRRTFGNHASSRAARRAGDLHRSPPAAGRPAAGLRHDVRHGTRPSLQPTMMSDVESVSPRRRSRRRSRPAGSRPIAPRP